MTNPMDYQLQPPVAHSSRDPHIISASKTAWTQQTIPVHQAYRYNFNLLLVYVRR